MRFLSVLCLLFIGLKLTGHIDWSWWLVLCPIVVESVIAGLMHAGLLGEELQDFARRRAER